MSDSVDEIKNKIDIVDLVREYMPVQQAGGNLKARCPFHQEKSASFMVSPSKQIWHCFGCNEGGDIFTFFMKKEGVDFSEALVQLAQKAGVQLERHDPRTQTDKQRLLKILDLAMQYYAQALARAPKGQIARDYLEKRGIGEDSITEFQLGYSLPDGDTLCQFLITRNISGNDIEKTGLGFRREQGYGYSDRFRNRLMIPIRDSFGHVVGFGARILDESVPGPKYINSPQTVLYDKSRILFGLDRAKDAIRASDAAIIVEGYMDMFAIWKAGMKNVVATSGTALTQDHVRLCKRFTSHLLFCFDMDTAGSQATLRGIQLALKEGADVRIVVLPKDEGGKPIFKDPDECIKADPAAWEQSVQGAIPFVQYCFDLMITPDSLSDAFEKKQVTRKLIDIIALLADRIEQDIWVKKLSGLMGVSERIIWEELTKSKAQLTHNAGQGAKEAQSQPAQATASKNATREELFLSFLITDPKRFDSSLQDVQIEMIGDPQLQDLYRQSSELYTRYRDLGSFDGFFQDVIQALPLEIRTRTALLSEHAFADLSEQEKDKTFFELIHAIKRDYVRRKTEEIQHLIDEAERDGDHARARELLEQVQFLHHS